MSSQKLAVRCGLLILLLATGFAQPSKPPFALTIKLSPGTESTEIDEEKAGAEIRLLVTLTNSSDRDLTFQFTSPLCDYIVVVRDSVGRFAPDTEQKRSANCASRMIGRNIYRTVKPKEAVSERIDLSEISDMSRPGKYSVQVIRKAPKQFGDTVVKSNLITVTVTE